MIVLSSAIFVLGLGVLSILQNCGAQPETRPIALIHHEEAAYEYFQKTHEHSDYECLRKFKEMWKEGRRNTCLKYLAGAKVSFSNPKDRTQYALDTFDNLVEETFKAEDNPVIENFTFETSAHGQLTAAALICIQVADTDSWAISPGFHEDVYFVFKRVINEADFRLFGLLEEVPQVVGYRYGVDFENLYKIGKNSPSDRNPNPDDKKNVRSLCSLSLNERFRLCAVALLSRRCAQRKFTEGFYIDQDIPKKHLCIKHDLLISSLEKEKKTPGEFISCAHDTDALHGSFFLISDPHSSNSAFLVDAYWSERSSNHSLDDKIRFFKILDQLKNIRTLKSFDSPK